MKLSDVFYCILISPIFILGLFGVLVGVLSALSFPVAIFLVIADWVSKIIGG